MQSVKLEPEEQHGRYSCTSFAAGTSSLAERSLILASADTEVSDEDDGGGFRRLLDIVASLILIAVLAPVLLMLVILIIVTDPGPPVFAHRRIGRQGKSFRCFKFRSMCVDADARLDRLLANDPVLKLEWQNGHKLACDPRVSPIGQLLRVTSLDELPQLFNVLTGSMTLVGPRPIVAAELKNYGRYAAHYLRVRPGLTGLWQVSGRSSTTYRRRVAADVLYVRSRSFALDCRILLATIPAVVTGKGSC